MKLGMNDISFSPASENVIHHLLDEHSYYALLHDRDMMAQNPSLRPRVGIVLSNRSWRGSYFRTMCSNLDRRSRSIPPDSSKLSWQIIN